MTINTWMGARAPRTWTLVGAVALALTTAVLGAPVPAGAAAGDKSRVGDGWNLRECGISPGTCGVFGYTVGDQWNETWCWRDNAEGMRWFKVTSWINTGLTHKWQKGWITASAVTQQATVPWCGSWDL